jgi:uncharacterized protein
MQETDRMDLTVLENTYSIFRFDSNSRLPENIYSSEFCSVTRTKDELSVVAVQNHLITGYSSCETDWRIIKINGPLAFSMTGVLAGISGILKETGIPIFVISTYETDYIMVKANDLVSAINALCTAGHTVSDH